MSTNVYYCVVAWNTRRNAVDSYYMCSRNRNEANRLKHRMTDRGMPRIRVVTRSSKPTGVESVRAAMSRWGLKPSQKIVRGR